MNQEWIQGTRKCPGNGSGGPRHFRGSLCTWLQAVCGERWVTTCCTKPHQVACFTTERFFVMPTTLVRYVLQIGAVLGLIIVYMLCRAVSWLLLLPYTLLVVQKLCIRGFWKDSRDFRISLCYPVAAILMWWYPLTDLTGEVVWRAGMVCVGLFLALYVCRCCATCIEWLLDFVPQ